MSAPILVVQHQDDCPPALFGTWLIATGAVLDVRRPYIGDALSEGLSAHAGLVVLGGSMNAVDDEATGWLAATKVLVREAVAGDVPLLGICLGHQIAAEALGGRVERNPAGTRRGLLDLGWADEAADDPLFAGLPVRAAHWNSDVVTVVPEGARVIATAPAQDVQVVRFSERAWGIQSHPEADEKVLRGWAEAEWTAVPPADRADVEAFLARAAEERESLARWWRPVAERFAALCADPAPGGHLLPLSLPHG